MSAGRLHYGRRPWVHGETLAPYRLLACRVITMAVRDLASYGPSRAERDSAREFLSGSPMLTHWCELAGVNPAVLSAHVGGLLERRASLMTLTRERF